jgi:hypothetical protein
MNSRGSYTALFGLAVLVLMVSMTFFMTTTASSQKSFIIVKEAGDLKRVFNNARHLFDQAASYALAEQVLEDFREEEGCRSTADFAPTLNRYAESIALDLKKETGFDCRFFLPAHIYDGDVFSVRLVCSRTTSKGVRELRLVSTADSFTLGKDVNASLNLSVSPRACDVNVFDLHANRLEVMDSAVEMP